MRDPLVTTADHVSRRDEGEAGDGRVWRYDAIPVGELMSPHLTAEGFVLCQGRAGRPCVLQYRRGDGAVVRELIPAEELHRPESLATLGRKALTLEHPPEDVDVGPDNVMEYAVGDLGSKVFVGEGGYVIVDIAIKRVDAVQAWKRGLNELSMGYKCRIDATPGVDPVLGPYDAVQRDRVYNHLALTGRARAGEGAAIRRDSAAQITDRGETMKPSLVRLLTLILGPTYRRLDAEDTALEEAAAKVAEMQTAISEATPAASVADLRAKIAALEAELAAQKAKLTAIEAASASAPSVPDQVEGAMEADPVDVTDSAAMGALAPEAQAEARKQDAIRKVVARTAGERRRLDSLAQRYRLDDKAVAKMGGRALRRAVAQAANPATRKDASDEYIRAAVDMLDDGARRDGSGGGTVDPYAGLGADFETNTAADRGGEGGGTRRDARGGGEDPSADPMAETLKRRFEQRHGTGARA